MIVSKKGQIVIPAPYRERLGIEPGMEVNVRIRGQVLVIELDTDIAGDIAFLEEIKGTLQESEFDMNSVEEIIRDLLCQQFYQGDDVLTDRVGKESIVIRGSDAIINETVKILTLASRHWLKGSYTETLREFADDLDLDFSSLLFNYVQKIRSMMPGGDTSMIEMMGGEVPFSMAVSTALTHFRERVGDLVTERLIKQAEEREYIAKLGKDTVDELITKSLAERYSILMNLRTLRELARTSVKSVGQRKFISISEELLDEYDELTTPDHVIKRRERQLRRRIQKARESGQEFDRERLKEEVGLADVRRPQSGREDEDDDEDSEALPEMPSFDF